ncbi:MAG: hypothetical protein K2X38_12160, partial [Gemmataceae bacterium]|nr:hypothetical protein [Gemmataceae bacterium]
RHYPDLRRPSDISPPVSNHSEISGLEVRRRLNLEYQRSQGKIGIVKAEMLDDAKLPGILEPPSRCIGFVQKATQLRRLRLGDLGCTRGTL